MHLNDLRTVLSLNNHGGRLLLCLAGPLSVWQPARAGFVAHGQGWASALGGKLAPSPQTASFPVELAYHARAPFPHVVFGRRYHPSFRMPYSPLSEKIRI